MPTDIPIRKLDAGTISDAILGPAWRRMSPFREVRKFVMAETAGPWYGQYSDYTRRDDDVKRPVNLLRQFVRTYLPNLCGPTIKAKVSEDHRLAFAGAAARVDAASPAPADPACRRS